MFSFCHDIPSVSSFGGRDRILQTTLFCSFPCSSLLKSLALFHRLAAKTYLCLRLSGRIQSISSCRQLLHGAPCATMLHLTFLCLHVAHALDDLFLPLRLEIGLGEICGPGSAAGEVVDEVWKWEDEALWRMRDERSKCSSIALAMSLCF